jgi:hypothetical protein
MKSFHDPNKTAATIVMTKELRAEIASIEQETGMKLAAITRAALRQYATLYRQQASLIQEKITV